MTSALLRKDLQYALEEQMVTTGLAVNDDARGFPVSGEGDHLHDFS
jgi:hypothetical protein